MKNSIISLYGKELLMKVFSAVIGLLILSVIVMGCTKSEDIQIPEYPNAVEDQEVKAEMLGMDFGGVRRVVTDDSFDTVFDFYKERLDIYDPEIIFHELEDGRQAAFTIKESEKSSKTVAVQEFLEEGKVAISYMNIDVGF
jgi:hypothetical protein